MEDRLPRRYRYRYRLDLFAGQWQHTYELIGRYGAVHLHITDLGEDRTDPAALPRFSAGLEYHHRVPPYDQNEPPSHDYCWLLKAPCWHDGTSMYAQEHYVPLFERASGNHVYMFLALVSDADEHLTPKVEED